MKKYDICQFLNKGLHAHLIGIGGVSMSPLAEVLSDIGIVVSGSDIKCSETTEHLASLGIKIHIGHSAENIRGADLIIRTAAARDDNVEVVAGHQAGIPVFERAQAWGAIMQNYNNAVCIAGTHGKTTTTSMTTHILMEAQRDPTVMIGGTLPLLKSGYHIGKGDSIIVESCEYYNSFLSFFPTIAVILNIEADHLDFFKGIDDIKQSFRSFAKLVPQNGYVIANADDVNTMAALSNLDRELLTYGLHNKAVITAANISHSGGGTEFDVIYKGEKYAHISLRVPGEHNVSNALASCSVAVAMGIDGSCVEAGLSSFTGAGRRLEYKGEYNGAKVYDDYAHHPGEIRALLNAVSELDFKRVICAFQPHTYTRTKALFNDFAKELSRPDIVLLADIYAAREKNTVDISSENLASVVENAEYISSFDVITKKLREYASPGDIIITVGAGDIYTVGEALVKA